MANLDGRHWNELEDRIVKRFKEREDMMVEALTSDGPPYGAELLRGRELFDHLVKLRAMGDPAFWGDPKAAVALAKLAELYGPPPPMPIPPLASPLEGVVQ